MAEDAQEAAPAKSGGKGIIIVLLVIMILLIIGIGVMAFLLLSSNAHGTKTAETPVAEASAEHGNGQAANGEAAHDDGVIRNYSPKYKQYEPPEPGSPPQYFAMEPFVVNFKGEGQAKYLAVTMKFMTHYPQLVKDMEAYRPELRNDITTLLRIQRYSVMSKDDGPDVLRKKVLEKAKAVLEKQGIYPDLLEDVYFERFVMQ
ncbi:MAG: flagellar basal body-associated FliL family protein [Hydrogenovibrio sp.]|nr:flagellar basal body-associated FliL family protein [Hydrogenovibrio sp.]